jgi:hypothetical protein
MGSPVWSWRLPPGAASDLAAPPVPDPVVAAPVTPPLRLPPLPTPPPAFRVAAFLLRRDDFEAFGAQAPCGEPVCQLKSHILHIDHPKTLSAAGQRRDHLAAWRTHLREVLPVAPRHGAAPNAAAGAQHPLLLGLPPLRRRCSSSTLPVATLSNMTESSTFVNAVTCCSMQVTWKENSQLCSCRLQDVSLVPHVGPSHHLHHGLQGVGSRLMCR